MLTVRAQGTSVEATIPESSSETPKDSPILVKNSYNLSSDLVICLLFSFIFRVLRYGGSAGDRFKTSFRRFSSRVKQMFMLHASSNRGVAILAMISLKKGSL